MSEDLILEARGILKQYPGLTALDRVHYRVRRNAVNVLIGENGAGKSTLMRILAGVERPDAGEIVLNGKQVALNGPRDASSLGIAIVHQELAVLPNLDLAENVFAGRELTRNALIDRTTEDSHTVSALERLGKPMSAKTPASALSLGRRQLVELARSLAHGASILILDEPTSALSMAEAETLFRVLAELKTGGMTIIYISHRLHELLHLGDYFTVLRNGRIVGEAARGEVDRKWIVERMSGRACSEQAVSVSQGDSAPILRVKDLCVAARQDDEAALDHVSFEVGHGEILGVYGLLGSGRTELLETLAGARRATAGTVTLRNKSVRLNDVAAMVNAGMVLVPEDRQRDGLIPELSIRENIALSSMSGGWIDRRQQAERTQKLARELSITAPDLERPITALSGGNQQKALLARCLMRSPAVLLLDEPTRGVDAGAKEEIYRILRQLAGDGLSIVFASSEIEETRTLAMRALVLCQGRIAAELRSAEMTDEALFAAASPQVSQDQVLSEVMA
jgi:erythritol transport system ATP-binding protein